MAQATTRTSACLGVLAVVFVVIIIILCAVPQGGSPHDETLQEQQKSKEVEGVITDTTTAATTTKTTTTTPPPPTTTAATTTTTSTTTTTTPPTPPPPTTTATPPPTTTTPPPTTPTPQVIHLINTTISSTTPPSSTPQNDTIYDDDDEPATTTAATTTTTTPIATNDTFLDDDDEDGNITTTITTTTTTDTITTSPLLDLTTATTTMSTEDGDDSNDTDTTTTITTPTTTTAAATTITTTTPVPDITTITTTCSVQETCNTPACKTVAANMLNMMDQTDVNPCQDFYQYACGGLMRNPFLKVKQKDIIANTLIKEYLETVDPDYTTKQGQMRLFYDSCLNAVNQAGKESWKATLKKVFGGYHFISPSSPGVTPFNLTEMLGHMMLHDFAPFFDIGTDVERSDTGRFSLTLHPALPGSHFSGDLARKVCLEDHHRRLENLNNTNSYNVAEEYEEFTDCVLRGQGLEARLERMEEAVRRFGLLDDIGNSSEAKEVLETTKEKTEMLLKNLADVLPSVPELKQDLANKNYITININDEYNSTVIQWRALLQQLMGTQSIPATLQTYKDNNNRKILTLLDKYKDDAALNNVLLMMWSEKLYTDFVKPLGSNVGEEEYCLQATITLMQEAASCLYMEALSDEEIHLRREQVGSIASSIKRVGKRELSRMMDAEEKLEYMLDLDNIIADSVQMEDVCQKEYEFNVTYDGFFDNCIQLLKNRRKVTYDMYSEATDDQPLRFLQPYKPYGVHVYEMSRIMIPFAAQEDSGTFTKLPLYLSYAGIGHMISQLVMHGYDTSGIQYKQDDFTKLQNASYFLNQTIGLQEQYQAEQSYKSSNGVTENVIMSTLGLNELLADSGATHLAWEAYLSRNEPDPTDAAIPVGKYDDTTARRRRRSLLEMLSRTKRVVSSPEPEMPLPWLNLSTEQLYFLHWSQHHCSATAGMSLLELTESVQPPARMRVNLVLQNDRHFNKAFKCTPKTEMKPFTLSDGVSMNPLFTPN